MRYHSFTQNADCLKVFREFGTEHHVSLLERRGEKQLNQLCGTLKCLTRVLVEIVMRVREEMKILVPNSLQFGERHRLLVSIGRRR